jgi:hypothetical protein
MDMTNNKYEHKTFVSNILTNINTDRKISEEEIN